MDNTPAPKEQTPRWIKVIRLSLSLLLTFLAFFGSAGTLVWPAAWLLLAIYVLFMAGFVIWLKKNNPELLRERAERHKNTKGWDKIILAIYSVLLLLLIIVSGLDAVRFQWSEVPLIVQIIAFLGLIPPSLLIFFTARANAYLSQVVRIQNDRGHQVAKNGPYRYIRHPMYLAIILQMLFIPPALGSWYGLIFSFFIILIFILRTRLEDETLQKELPGYKEYTQEVRYRLFPGIW